VTKEDYEDARKPRDVLFLIATALRTQCIKTDITFYDTLLEKEFIKMNKDKTFDVLTDNKYL
jgi:hypothetical protein